MNNRKRYRVTVDGGAYTANMNDGEVEALHRRHHGFVSVREVIAVKVVEPPTFDYDKLVQEITDYDI